MPKVRRRSYRSLRKARRRKNSRPSLLTVVLLLTAGILLIAYLAHMRLNQLAAENKPQDKTYSLVNEPTVSADFIDQVLDYYQSPARGKGQALYDYGVQYGIDPAYALAFFMQESTLGTRGVAAVTRSLGNIRATAGHPQYKGYRAYATWEEGFADWYRLVAKQYVERWGLTTIDQIIPVYAPASDHNNEKLYISSVKHSVNMWRSGSIVVS